MRAGSTPAPAQTDFGPVTVDASCRLNCVTTLEPPRKLLMLTAQWLAPALLAAAMSANAQDGTFQSRSLTPEAALTAARAALDACRKQGFQVAVAVTDRAGITQVLLRDRFAGPHTVDVASNKAWTAVSFRTSTLALAAETQPGRPMSGLRNLPRFLAAGGGRVI